MPNITRISSVLRCCKSISMLKTKNFWGPLETSLLKTVSALFGRYNHLAPFLILWENFPLLIYPTSASRLMYLCSPFQFCFVACLVSPTSTNHSGWTSFSAGRSQNRDVSGCMVCGQPCLIHSGVELLMSRAHSTNSVILWFLLLD